MCNTPKAKPEELGKEETQKKVDNQLTEQHPVLPRVEVEGRICEVGLELS
jgi:hypothetical protein